jgi:cell wall-associated NlpC family hydrolase
MRSVTLKKKKFISVLFAMFLSPVLFAATSAYAASPSQEKVINDTTKALQQVQASNKKVANKQEQQRKQLTTIEQKIQQLQIDLQQVKNLTAIEIPTGSSLKKSTSQAIASSAIQTQNNMSFEAEKQAELLQLKQEKAAIQQLSTSTAKKQRSLEKQQTELTNKLAQTKKQEAEQKKKADDRAAVVAAAKKQLGKPYVYGAAGPDAFDCSGLVQVSFAAIGRSLGRTTVDQETAGSVIPVEQAQAGDLVFWGSHGSTHHVGISTGDGSYIHAPVPGDVVQITTVSSYKPDFALRVL